MKNIKYVVKGFIAHSQKDNWENGCIGQTQTQFVNGRDWECSSSTLQSLLAALCDEFSAPMESVSLDACEELGRLDIQVNQLKPFECAKLSNKSLEKWKRGEIDVWLTDYTFHVIRIEEEFSLTNVLEEEKQ